MTTETAFQIGELGNLVWLREQAAARLTTATYYTLLNGIDASLTATWNDTGTTTSTPEGFHPIGTYAAPFRGVFEGNGHMIVGLTISRLDEDYVGLFGCIGSGGEVRDLGLEGGVVSGRSNVGGLVGYSDSGTVTNCYTTGSVRGQAKSGWYMFVFFPGSPCSVGGLVGCNSGGAIVECHSASQVLGSAVPPFNAFSHGQVTVTGTGYPCYFGGLVGSNGGGGVTNSSATGSVSGYAAAGFYSAPGSASYVGGLIGSNTGGSVATSFANGAATGVTAAYAQALAGGLAGENTASGRIIDCYARGEATIGGSPTVSDHAGGLVADNAGSGVIARCYATGTGSGGSTGGLAASNATSATITACYWDAETTSQTTSAGGTSKTTAEMKEQATFVGWDFATVWGIAAGSNNGYPYLRLPGGPPGAPNKAANPRPPDGAAAQMLDVMLGWEDGGGATSYDVYLDTANPPATKVASGQTETTYAPPAPLDYATTYFWRIDAQNTSGTAVGAVWSFTTVPAPKVPGHFLSRRVKSSHSEKWNAQDARIRAKDAYSFSAKMQLPAGSLAAISNATTLTLVLGDAVTSGAACEVFERPLSAATKSTLDGHLSAKNPKDPTRGGSVTFVELQPNSKKKARVVTIKWTKTGVLTATVVGAPALANWDPSDPAQRREVENIADLCDGAEWPEGMATGVAVPTLVDLSGVFIGADTVACGGKKSVKPSDGGDLVGWSVSGK